MKGKSALIWLGLTGVAGIVLFQTSYRVQGREELLASLNRKIVAEQESIQILKAEWSYLNDPSGLETMARTHLSLRPTDARQFLASAEIIPMRPAPAPMPEVAPSLPPMAGLVRAPQTAAAATAAVVKAAPAPGKAPAPSSPAPAPAVVEPAAVKVVPKAQPAVVKPQQPQPQSLTPPKNNIVPANAPANAKPPAPTKSDSLGVMIARLGGTR